MKKGKKALIATVVFAAALNLNGCVYGPPPAHEDKDNNKPGETSKVESVEDESVDSTTK